MDYHEMYEACQADAARPNSAHLYESDFDADWHYLDGCGCWACVMWGIWTTGWDHPTIEDEQDWWDWTEQGLA